MAEDPITTGNEAHERDLDRHRASEQRDARAEALDRLDTPPSTQPDNPRFVLPRRSGDESILDFTKRVRAAAMHLEH